MVEYNSGTRYLPHNGRDTLRGRGWGPNIFFNGSYTWHVQMKPLNCRGGQGAKRLWLLNKPSKGVPQAPHGTPLSSYSDTTEHRLLPAMGLSGRDAKEKEHVSLWTCGSFSDFLLILHAVTYIWKTSLFVCLYPSGMLFCTHLHTRFF